MLLSVPAILLVAALLWAPIVQAIRYSMTSWNGYSAPAWIGPSAYTAALSDPIVHRVLENNALLLLAVPFAIGIPLVIAALLHEHVRGWRFFRSVYFLPTAISWVVIGMVALQFFAANGMLNQLLADVGLGSVHTDMLAVGVQRAGGAGDHVHLVDDRHEHDHLPDRHGHARPDPDRGGPGRRPEPVADLLPRDAAAADQVHPVRLRDHGHQRVLRAVQPDLRDDRRRARARHHHAGVLRLPGGLRAGPVRHGRAVRDHPVRHHDHRRDRPAPADQARRTGRAGSHGDDIRARQRRVAACAAPQPRPRRRPAAGSRPASAAG